MYPMIKANTPFEREFNSLSNCVFAFVREYSQLRALRKQEICGVPRFLSNTSLFLLVLVGKSLEMGTKSLVSYFWAKKSWYGFLMRRFLNGRNQLYRLRYVTRFSAEGPSHISRYPSCRGNQKPLRGNQKRIKSLRREQKPEKADGDRRPP